MSLGPGQSVERALEKSLQASGPVVKGKEGVEAREKGGMMMTQQLSFEEGNRWREKRVRWEWGV